MSDVLVSLIIVCFNAEKYIEKSLLAFINQDVGLDKFELIIVDGDSSDNTISIVQDVFSKHSNIKHKIINNKKRTLATGWNIGVLEANGKFVCRVDAHSDIPNNYISKLLDDYFNIMQFDDSVVGVGGVLT
ncbi:glycosyltransferase, partial [Shigella sonnei]|nr:glycosyltransferase [Shigella sonnei]